MEYLYYGVLIHWSIGTYGVFILWRIDTMEYLYHGVMIP